MKSTFYKKLFLFFLITTLSIYVGAYATTEYQTFEGKVMMDNSSSGPYLKIIGSDSKEYRILATDGDASALRAQLKSDPNLIIALNGEYVDQDGEHLFKLHGWKKIVTETTKSMIDSNGNSKVETHTETQTIQ